MSKINPVLELKIPDEKDGSVFYRYVVGDFKIWFTQYDDGNIFGVMTAANSPSKEKFSLRAFDSNKEPNLQAYPNSFTMSCNNSLMSIEQTAQYIKETQEALDCLESIKELFFQGPHFELYCKKAIENILEHTNLDNYELGGVEITSDDVTNIASKIHAGDDINAAVDEYLTGIREILDAGLDEQEECL